MRKKRVQPGNVNQKKTLMKILPNRSQRSSSSQTETLQTHTNIEFIIDDVWLGFLSFIVFFYLARLNCVLDFQYTNDNKRKSDIEQDRRKRFTQKY